MRNANRCAARWRCIAHRFRGPGVAGADRGAQNEDRHRPTPYWRGICVDGRGSGHPRRESATQCGARMRGGLFDARAQPRRRCDQSVAPGGNCVRPPSRNSSVIHDVFPPAPRAAARTGLPASRPRHRRRRRLNPSTAPSPRPRSPAAMCRPHLPPGPTGFPPSRHRCSKGCRRSPGFPACGCGRR